MIFCDECSLCVYQKIVEEDADKAKTFFDEYGSSYVFKCGAIFNRKFMNSSKYHGCEVVPSNYCLKKRK